MFSIVGKLDKEGILTEGFNADHIISFKVLKDKKDGEMVLELILTGGVKQEYTGAEAKMLYDKVLAKNLQVSLTAVSTGGANAMLHTLQTQLGAAKKKAQAEAAGDSKKPQPLRRSI